ncbi:uncharacterized protein LOC112514883 [Cynara cardunculus var. scolymus]|uniref:Uncharacterized protein n=1 Tax=Cynara cardunculus var. scolymus TaxID=59895 RepID=A0A103XZ56_CYNCS|nr:uncharacterized protein LOC112514883 [Cynara cardunculus var. scolymus]KVH99578.1 hypothetical protein Ccrd_022188 [Cynara cardunculus var. scolymus]
MAKKRKSLATTLDEVDRTMYSNFCNAANSLSQLYSQAMSQQKLSFLSGERHGLEKLYQWISKQEAEGLRVTSEDILAYIQGELESSCVEEAPLARQQVTNPPSINCGSSSDQAASKNYIFSNALSSPVRRSLQNYHISSQVENQILDSSMDMHADHD